jgi:hypothetical protein
MNALTLDEIFLVSGGDRGDAASNGAITGAGLGHIVIHKSAKPVAQCT